MGNAKRGVVDIDLDDKTHQMRFTLGAIEELEEHFGEDGAQVKLAELFKGATEWCARDYSVVFHAGLKRGSLPDSTREEVSEMLVFSDFGYYAERLAVALQSANTGRKKAPDRPTDGVTPPTEKPAATASISTN